MKINPIYKVRKVAGENIILLQGKTNGDMTRVVAFNESACGEGIVHGESGWIAKPGDIQSYADGLLYYYKIWERTGTTLFSKNYSEYTSDCVGKQWRNLYKTLCEK